MRFVCVLCVLCGSIVPAFSLNRAAFTFTKYDLNVRVEPEMQRLAVRGTILLRNDSGAPQKDLSLQISSSLDWRSISLDGKPVEFASHAYTSDIDHTGALSEAIVSLPQEVPPQATIALEIGYEGVILLDTSRLTRIGVPEDTAKNTDWDQIGKSFSAVRGIGYVAWYPVETEAANLSQENSVPETVGQWRQREASAGMRVQFCLWKAASSLTALMNDQPADDQPDKENAGKIAGESVAAESNAAESNATADCHQHVFAPLGQTVPLLVIGRYETLVHPGVAISYSPEHKAGAGNYALASNNVLPFVTGWFGSPRQDARFAELSEPAAAPYESGGVLLTPLTEIDVKLAELTAVHQLTHAAFPSPRLWIYEGLAHFSQAVYTERLSNRESALHFMGDHLATIVAAEKSFAVEGEKLSSEQSLINTGMEELYRSKAMYVWWMLRDMLGEAALKQVLAAYRPDQDKDNDNDNEPFYLQHLLEAQSKRDLTWFFDDWVYHDRGLPDFRVDSVFPSQMAQGGYLVTVTVQNLGGAGAEVPVTLRSSGGDETRRLEVRGKSKVSIRFVAQSPPSEVVINDGSVPESDMSNNTFTIQKQ
jgi:hypothetical protein